MHRLFGAVAKIRDAAKDTYNLLFENEKDRIKARVKRKGETFALGKDKSIAFKTIIQAYLRESGFEAKLNNATNLRELDPIAQPNYWNLVKLRR